MQLTGTVPHHGLARQNKEKRERTNAGRASNARRRKKSTAWAELSEEHINKVAELREKVSNSQDRDEIAVRLGVCRAALVCVATKKNARLVFPRHLFFLPATGEFTVTRDLVFIFLVLFFLVLLF